MTARTTHRLLIALCLVAALATLGWWLGRPKPVSVSLARIEQGVVETTLANTRAGSVEACQRTRLSTIIGGRIEVLAVREGDTVAKGQLLMQLWNADQRAQTTLAERQTDTARRRATEVCTLAANAGREAERQSALAARGFVSPARDEAARAEAEARQASCAAARADIAQAEARREVTRVEQGRTRLVAPFAGIVAKIVGEVGEYSTPSPPGVPTPPAIDLIDASCVYIKAPMDEVDAPRLQPGLPVRISLDALPGQQFAGSIRRVAPVISALEKQARTVDIEVRFDDPGAPGPLLVGYSADVEVVLKRRENVVRVPTAALRAGQVLVAGADGRLAARQVSTGVSNWEFTEITEGLRAGEQIVTSLERQGVLAGALWQDDAATAKQP